MPDQTITILEINGDKLILSDGGTTEVKSKREKRSVTWEIKDEVIESFRIVGNTSYSPFDKPIPTNYRKSVTLKVNKDHPELD
jgi:hypothetical protein